MKRSTIVAAFCVVGFLGTAAHAQEPDQAVRNQARQYAEEGLEAYKQGDYAKAVDRLSRANNLLPVPTVGVRLARSLAKTGKLVEAAKVYEGAVKAKVAADAPEVFRKAVTEAADELAALLPRIPTIVIQPDAGIGEITLDGAAVKQEEMGKPIRVNPGPHRVGGRGASPEAVTAKEGERLTVTLHLPGKASGVGEDQPGKQGTDWRLYAGIAGLGAGGVALGVGIVASVKVNGAQGTLDKVRIGHPATFAACTNATPQDVARAKVTQHDLDNACGAAKSFTTMQIIMYPLAAVLGGVGIFFLATRPKKAAVGFTVIPSVGYQGGGLDVAGTF